MLCAAWLYVLPVCCMCCALLPISALALLFCLRSMLIKYTRTMGPGAETHTHRDTQNVVLASSLAMQVVIDTSSTSTSSAPLAHSEGSL